MLESKTIMKYFATTMTKKLYSSVNDIIANKSHYMLKSAQKGIIGNSDKNLILQCFSSSLAKQLTPLSIKSSILLIGTASASIASKARFESGAALQKLQDTKLGDKIKSIQIKVSMAKIKDKPTIHSKLKPTQISTKSKLQIDRLASDIKDDELISLEQHNII